MSAMDAKSRISLIKFPTAVKGCAIALPILACIFLLCFAISFVWASRRTTSLSAPALAGTFLAPRTSVPSEGLGPANVPSYPDLSTLSIIRAPEVVPTSAMLAQELFAGCSSDLGTDNFGYELFAATDGTGYFEIKTQCGVWSPDGRRSINGIYQGLAGWTDLLVHHRGQWDNTPLTGTSYLMGMNPYVAWSPNSQEAAFYVRLPQEGFYLMDLGEPVTSPKITLLLKSSLDAHDQVIGRPIWAPDGSKIAFTDYYPHNLPTPLVVSRDGHVLWQGPKDTYPFDDMISWAPDSNRFVYSVFTNESTAENSHMQLRIADIRSNRITTVNLKIDAFDPHWSPDGQWIVFTSPSIPLGTGERLYRCKPDGSGLTHIAHNAGFLDWSPNGKEFAIYGGNPDSVDPTLEETRIYIANLDDTQFLRAISMDKGISGVGLQGQGSVSPFWLPSLGSVTP